MNATEPMTVTRRLRTASMNKEHIAVIACRASTVLLAAYIATVDTNVLFRTFPQRR